MNSNKKLLIYIEVVLDIAVMFGSYLVANWLKFGYFRTGMINRTEHYLTLFLMEMVAYIVVHFLAFANDRLVYRNIFQETYTVVKMYVYILACTVAGIYFGKLSEQFSRMQMGLTFVIAPIMTIIARQILKRLVTKEFHRSGANEKIMLVTTSDQVANVVKQIKKTRNWDFRISNIAVVDCDMIGEVVDKIEVVASKENLIDVISTSEIDSVFVHLPDQFAFDQKTFVRNVMEMGKTVHLNVNEFEAKYGERRLDFLGRFAVVTWKNQTYRFRQVFLKKVEDMIFGILGCIILIPVWILVMLGKLLTGSRGPMIIQIVRVGKNGRRFYYNKFRTMHANAQERYDKWLLEGKQGPDPRFTVVGKILKKTHLENLPCAWNIFWGDMSMVGNPAPSLPEYLDYSLVHRKSLSIKPGVFGYWQAYQKDFCLLDEEEQCEADQEYIRNWTLGLDWRIIFRVIMPFCKSVSRHELTMPSQVLDEMRFLGARQREKEPLWYDDTIYVHEKSFLEKTYDALKRLVDIVTSLLCLVVLSPIFLVLAVIIKLSDGGTIFYGHTRIGYHGKKISVYKFRSMKTDVGDLEKLLTPEQLEQYRTEFKIDDDPRITKIGNFLRRTSLDELPQLFNILKGELSIVGPRPIVEKETEIYGRDIGKLLSVKPGLTGYWQAYARNNASYETGERQSMEMYYVEHRSLWLDIKIIIKTFFSVIKEDGAQ